MKSRSGPRRQGTAAAVKSSAVVDFRYAKLRLALAIMSVGMVLALVWAALEGWGLGRDYPHNTFLFSPEDRFNDFSDMIIDAGRENPYLDPYGLYLPFAWVVFRIFFALPYLFSLTAFLFLGVGGLFVLLVAVFADVVASPWKRVLLALGLLAFSYPVLIAVDRANLEFYLAIFAGGALYFIGRARYGLGMLCLVLSMSFKLYPAVFFLLLLRQRRAELIAVGVLLFLLASFLSMRILSLPLETGFEYYGRNLVFLNWAYIYENYALEGCSSLWNLYKLGLITAAHLGWISPVDFSFDGSFIGNSYSVYTAIVTLIAVALALYVCLVEKEFLRCAMALLIYLSISTPLGADYRLLYANIALVALILVKTRRRHDVIVLILLALTMVPKKEFFLTYAGRTETGEADVSIQVVLNPLLMTAALIYLVYDGMATFDAGWSRLRWRRLLRSIVARSATKSALLTSKT